MNLWFVDQRLEPKPSTSKITVDLYIDKSKTGSHINWLIFKNNYTPILLITTIDKQKGQRLNGHPSSYVSASSHFYLEFIFSNTVNLKSNGDNCACNCRHASRNHKVCTSEIFQTLTALLKQSMYLIIPNNFHFRNVSS